MNGARREADRRRPPRFRLALLAASGVCCLALTALYALRPGPAEALTFAPAWVWAIPGLLLAGLGVSRATRRAAGEALALWVVFLLVTTEGVATLLPVRSWPSARWQAARAQGNALRVVSLNCAGGSTEAANEVAAYEPDIVLLQESPGRQDVEALGTRLFGERSATVVGLDTSIVTHGSLAAAELPPSLRRFFVQASVELPGGRVAEVISLRLMPGTARVDLWSPDCWRQQAESHRARVEELTAVASRLARMEPGTPVIVGGDFNAPAGDGVFRTLPEGLTDAFRSGGVGWGDTMMNELPVLRFDQVWLSRELEAAAVAARRTRHSDHRLVVCDLVVRSTAGQR